MAFTPQNPRLYGVLKEAVPDLVDEFIREGKDFDSEEFIGHFSYIFVGDREQINPNAERRRQILAAGFLPEYEVKTREALGILCANYSGWTTEGLFCLLVNDFLNYVIPRVGNLPNWEQRFDEFYAAFEADIYSDSIGVSTVGVLRNVYDHSGSFRPTGQARKTLHKNALILPQLNHPNGATIPGFDTQQGVNFLVTEYIPEITLRERVAAGPLLEKEVLHLGVQLAKGLAAAYEHRVVHRNLKPRNLHLTGDGRLKVPDFGLVRRATPLRFQHGNLI